MLLIPQNRLLRQFNYDTVKVYLQPRVRYKTRLESKHHFQHYLILLSPGPYSWSVHSKHLKRILSSHNQSNGKQFEIRDEVTQVSAEEDTL